MTISARTGVTTENSSTTSITGTLPTGTAATDVVVAIFGMPGTVAQFTGPAGWTLIAGPTNIASNTEVIAAYWKVNPGAGPQATTSGAAGRATVIVQSYVGVDNTTPIDVTAVMSTTNGTSIAATGVTTVTASAWVLSGYMFDSSTRTPVTPTSFTSDGANNGSSGGRGLGLAHLLQTTPGATGTVTWSMTPSATIDQAAFVTALRPAAIAFSGTMAETYATTADLQIGMSGSRTETYATSATLGLSLALSGSRTETFSSSASLDVVSRQFFGTLEVELTAGVWTDITTYCKLPVTIHQGRATPYDPMSPATMSFTLWNDDGRFMPENTASTYSPNWAKGKRVRWKVTKSSTTYTRFFGFIQAIQPEYPAATLNGAIVNVTAVDALGLLAQLKLRSNFTEIALWRALNDVTHIDMYEAAGRSSGNIVQLTNYSSDAAKQSAGGVWSAGSANLSNSSPDGQVSVGGILTWNNSPNWNSVLANFQATNLNVVLHLKLPPELMATAGTHYVIATFHTSVGGGAAQCSLAITPVAGRNQLVLRNAANNATHFTFGNSPFDQWVSVKAVQNGTTAANSDWAMYAQDGTAIAFNNLALDIRNTRAIEFPSNSSGVNVIASSAAGGIYATGTRTGLNISDSFVGYDSGTLSSRISSLNTIVGVRLASAVTISTTGTLSSHVATGDWSGRDALTVLQEMLNSYSGLSWARSRDGVVYAIGSDATYPTTVLATIDVDADCTGTPRLVDGAESKPTRVDVTYPGGQTSYIDTVAESAGISRAKAVTTTNLAESDALAVGSTLISRLGGGMRISEVTLDLAYAATDHTTEVLDESATLSGLFPSCRVRLVIPTEHFGVPTRDVHVQGWTETYQHDAVTVKLDTTPAVASTLGSDTFTGSNGAAFSATFTTRVDVNGAGTAVIQSNRGRITTAAAFNAQCYAPFTVTPADVEFTGTFALQSSGSVAVLQGKSTTLGSNGYWLVADTSGSILLLRNFVTVASWSMALSASTDYKVRFRLAGAYLNARVWLASGSEPGTWDAAYVDTSPLSGTHVAIGSWSDSVNNVARAVDWDNVTITTIT